MDKYVMLVSFETDAHGTPEKSDYQNSDFTWLHELMVQTAPGLIALLQVLFHDLDINEGTVALWEAGWAMAPAVIVAAVQLALWVACHIAKGCLDKTPTQKFWQDILQAWKRKKKYSSFT